MALGLLGSLASGTGAGPSAPADVFVPSDRVPLSEFKAKSSNSVTLHVDPEVLAWVSSHSGTVQVCVLKTNGNLQYVTPTSTNSTTGVVTYTNPLLMGKAVVVSSLLKQCLTVGSASIVTHWDASLNSGRGGQSVGATDGIGTIDLNVTTGEIEVTGSIGNTHSDWPDVTPENPYYFASDVYALFSDGSGETDDAEVPAYERYIAENFDLDSPTNLAAIWLSDQARATTGLPVAHRNYPEAFDSGAAAGLKLEDALPVFQIVHGYIVPFEDESVEGKEQSLASFVVPPTWTSSSGAYPVLLNGFYDLHSATFLTNGPGMIATLGELYHHAGGARLVIGILWNGGGSAACYTTQRSAYDNVAQLLADAATELLADPEEVVFTGGSRGGITALEMASNPYGYDDTARFVNASVPPLRMGSSIALASPAFALGLASTKGVAGWDRAWESSWTEPGTGLTGLEVTMRNLFGTTDPEEIDDDLSIDSAPFIAPGEEDPPVSSRGLVQEEVGVVLRVGTHDAHRPYSYVAQYVDRLRAAGVPVHFEVYYRAGHVPDVAAQPGDLELLDMIFDNASLETSIQHFARDPEDYTLSVEISPSHIPLTYETPITVGAGQTHTWSFVGEPGAHFQVRAAYLGGSWTSGSTWPTSFSAVLTGTLSADTGAVFGVADYQMPAPTTAGYYAYEVDYDYVGSSASDVTLGVGDFAPPTRYSSNESVVLVPLEEQPGANDHSRTGGVAEDGHLLP